MMRLATVGLLVSSSLAGAAIAPQRIELRPYGSLNVPPEATAAATGGLGVVATDRVKATVVVEYTGGAPCGPVSGFDDVPRRGGSAPDAGEMNVWLPAGIGAASVATLGLVGFFLLRRTRA